MSVNIIEVNPRVGPPLVRIPMSRAEYEALPNDLPRMEWSHGEAIVMDSPNYPHQNALARLQFAFQLCLPNLGVVHDYDTKMSNSTRRPDLQVVAEPPVVQGTQTPLVVVEVLSDSTRQEDLVRKAAEYAERGIGQYWTVDLWEPEIIIRRNIHGAWTTATTLNVVHPVADVPIADYGTVHLDLNDIIRWDRNVAAS